MAFILGGIILFATLFLSTVARAAWSKESPAPMILFVGCLAAIAVSSTHWIGW